MLILFVAPRYHTNQIPIVEGLQQAGYNIRFLVMYRGVSEDYELLEPDILSPSLTVRRRFAKINKEKGKVHAENWLLRHYKPSILKLIQYLKKVKPDIVILRERSRQSRIVSLCCKMLGIRKVILYNQEPLYTKQRTVNWKRLLGNIVLPKVRYTPVKYVKLLDDTDDALLHKQKQHEYFIPFVQAVCILPEEKKYMENGIVRILAVGKYRDYKNHKILIEAVSLVEVSENFQVTIIGQVSNEDEQTYFDDLRKLIQTKNLSDRVMLLKNVPFREMTNIYAENDIFVLPSKREVASISVLEAMAHGLCIISTDNNGTAFYVLEGDAGYIFNHASAKDLSEKLSYLIENPNEIERCGGNSINYIQDRCQYKDYHRGLKNIVKKEFSFSLKDK